MDLEEIPTIVAQERTSSANEIQIAARWRILGQNGLESSMHNEEPQSVARRSDH